MNNLQPLKWDVDEYTGEPTSRTMLHGYIVMNDGNGKFKVAYYLLSGGTYTKFATGFATIEDAKTWCWNHYNEKMQPYLDASRYPATFTESFSVEGFTEGFVVQFRDVPEAITQGDTFTEAVEMAQDALQTAMEFYDEDNKPRPKPSAAIHGDVMIDINSTMQNLHNASEVTK